MKPTINLRREKFVAKYLETGNATLAAREAGYSERSAHAQGCRLLKEAEVVAAISKARDTLKLEPARVLGELSRVAFADPAQVFDQQGRLLTVSQMPEDVRRAVSGFDVEMVYARSGKAKKKVIVGETVKLRFWNKVETLALLMRHLGLLKENPPASSVVVEIYKNGAGQEAVRVGVQK